MERVLGEEPVLGGGELAEEVRAQGKDVSR